MKRSRSTSNLSEVDVPLAKEQHIEQFGWMFDSLPLEIQELLILACFYININMAYVRRRFYMRILQWCKKGIIYKMTEDLKEECMKDVNAGNDLFLNKGVPVYRFLPYHIDLKELCINLGKRGLFEEFLWYTSIIGAVELKRSVSVAVALSLFYAHYFTYIKAGFKEVVETAERGGWGVLNGAAAVLSLDSFRAFTRVHNWFVYDLHNFPLSIARAFGNKELESELLESFCFEENYHYYDIFFCSDATVSTYITENLSSILKICKRFDCLKDSLLNYLKVKQISCPRLTEAPDLENSFRHVTSYVGSLFERLKMTGVPVAFRYMVFHPLACLAIADARKEHNGKRKKMLRLSVLFTAALFGFFKVKDTQSFDNIVKQMPQELGISIEVLFCLMSDVEQLGPFITTLISRGLRILWGESVWDTLDDNVSVSNKKIEVVFKSLTRLTTPDKEGHNELITFLFDEAQGVKKGWLFNLMNNHQKHTHYTPVLDYVMYDSHDF